MKYDPKKMAAVSRYQDYFPTLSPDIQQDILKRMDELIIEEQEYCDKGNYKHMAQILTSIAIYEVLQRHRQSEQEAYRVVSEEMWKFLDPSGMQRLAKKSFFLPLMKKIVPLGFKKGSGFGWRYTWYKDDPKNEFHFECNECIFCANDERCYGNLPGLEFKRAGTIGTGSDRCDFYLRKI